MNSIKYSNDDDICHGFAWGIINDTAVKKEEKSDF